MPIDPSLPWEFVRDMADALRIDKPVVSITLHADVRAAVTAEVKFLVTKEEGANLLEVLRKYQVQLPNTEES